MLETGNKPNEDSLSKYDKLSELLAQYNTDKVFGLNNIKAHIKELHLEVITSKTTKKEELDRQIAQPNARKPSKSDNRSLINKEHIAKQLKRIHPTNEQDLYQLEIPNTDTYTTEPKEMAKHLNKHWEKEFGRKPYDKTQCLNSLSKYNKKLKGGNWELMYKHIEQAIDSAKNTSPGPNGIPFKAYKILKALCIPIIFDVIMDLMNPEGHPVPTNSNYAILHLLAKKIIVTC